MFGYYNMGAGLPQPQLAHVPAMPSCARDLIDSLGEVRSFSESSRSAIGASHKASNFLTGKKHASIFDYHKSQVSGSRDIETIAAVRQVPSKMANPQITVSRLLLAQKNDAVSVFITAKQTAARNFGFYKVIRSPKSPSIRVPLVTLQMVMDTQSYLVREIRKSRRGSDVNAQRNEALELKAIEKDATRAFNRIANDAGIHFPAINYVRLIKTAVLPGDIANRFWSNSEALSKRIQSVRGITAYTTWGLLGDSFYQSARDAASHALEAGKAIVKAVPTVLKGIKTVAIVVAILLGGFLIWKIFGTMQGVAA